MMIKSYLNIVLQLAFRSLKIGNDYLFSLR